jgi:hypothetical protein
MSSRTPGYAYPRLNTTDLLYTVSQFRRQQSQCLTADLYFYASNSSLQLTGLYLLFSLLSLRRNEPGSSGSIVSDYGLDYRAIGVRSLAGAKEFSSNLCVQTGSGAHPASCTMCTGGPFPGAKRGWGVTLTTQNGGISNFEVSAKLAPVSFSL